MVGSESSSVCRCCLEVELRTDGVVGGDSLATFQDADLRQVLGEHLLDLDDTDSARLDLSQDFARHRIAELSPASQTPALCRADYLRPSHW